MTDGLTTWLVMLGLTGFAFGCFAIFVWALVDAARNGKWVWFVLTFFFPLLCVVYLLFACEGRPARVREVQRFEPVLRDPPRDDA